MSGRAVDGRSLAVTLLLGCFLAVTASAPSVAAAALVAARRA